MNGLSTLAGGGGGISQERPLLIKEWNADRILEPFGKNLSLFYEIPDRKKQKVISNNTIRIVNVSVTYLWGLIYHNVLISVVIRRHEGGDWAARVTSGRIPRKF